MRWRALMKVGNKSDFHFSGLQEISTKSTKPLEPDSENPNQGNFVDIVDEFQRFEESPPRCSIQPGGTIQYRIPKIVSPTNYDWEWQRGKIGMVDEQWQMALVIPEMEPEPWRWVPLIYIRRGAT